MWTDRRVPGSDMRNNNERRKWFFFSLSTSRKKSKCGELSRLFWFLRSSQGCDPDRRALLWPPLHAVVLFSFWTDWKEVFFRHDLFKVLRLTTPLCLPAEREMMSVLLKPVLKSSFTSSSTQGTLLRRSYELFDVVSKDPPQFSNVNFILHISTFYLKCIMFFVLAPCRNLSTQSWKQRQICIEFVIEDLSLLIKNYIVQL